jgi:hypothetical protein
VSFSVPGTQDDIVAVSFSMPGTQDDIAPCRFRCLAPRTTSRRVVFGARHLGRHRVTGPCATLDRRRVRWGSARGSRRRGPRGCTCR